MKIISGRADCCHDNNCRSAITVPLNITSAVKADFIFENIVCEGTPFSFTDKSQTNNQTLISWLWSFDGHSLSDLQNPRYVFTDAGSYQTSLYVTTDKGCTDAASKIISIKEKEACDTDTDFSLFIPSAFTPNNDGINDFFLPSGKNSGELQMKIFDRWGETVFENSGSNTSWNGRGTKEIPLNEGAYAYEIAAKDLSGIVHYFTGHLLLLR